MFSRITYHRIDQANVCIQLPEESGLEPANLQFDHDVTGLLDVEQQ